MRISIIGTAGRKEAAPLMTVDLYRLMIKSAMYQVDKYDTGAEGTLVSGGAAWSDHLAISLFKKKIRPSLHLHLPAELDFPNNRFSEKTRDGGIANYYHRQFSQKIGVDTLKSICNIVQETYCTYDVSSGFFARNRLVGDCDVLIAYTWGEGNQPADGGTLNTWKSSYAPIKVHIPLSQSR